MSRTKTGRSRASPLTTLVMAWLVVVGLAFVPVFAYSKNTGDLRVVFAFLSASLLVGAALLAALGLSWAAARARDGPPVDHIADLRRRGALFGRR